MSDGRNVTINANVCRGDSRTPAPCGIKFSLNGVEGETDENGRVIFEFKNLSVSEICTPTQIYLKDSNFTLVENKGSTNRAPNSANINLTIERQVFNITQQMTQTKNDKTLCFAA